MRLIVVSLFLFSLQLSGQNCTNVNFSYQIQRVLPDCNRGDGEIIIAASGGAAPYSYRIDTIRSDLGYFVKLVVGSYPIMVTDDRGCTDTTVVDLLYDDISKFINPSNAFSPNGDEINDRWTISGIESFQGSVVRVYNRWGQLIHTNSPYVNEFGWDGNQNGAKLPSGTYFYVITVVNNCVEDRLSGSVTIVR